MTLHHPIALLFIIMSSGCLADLRPEMIKLEGVSERRSQEGRRLLAKMTEAHGGLDVFKQKKVARVELVDVWPSTLMRKLVTPWAENNQHLDAYFEIGKDNGRIKVLKDGEVSADMGIQHWVTYRVDLNEVVFDDEPDGDTKFWIPTVQYFFEAPFRLNEAELVQAIGQEVVAGRAYDVVFLSWGQAKPQSTIDQYLVYIDVETRRLGYLQYTVREMGSWIKGAMHYDNYFEKDGLWLAKTMEVVDEMGKPDGLHRMTVESVRFDQDDVKIVWDSSRRAQK